MNTNCVVPSGTELDGALWGLKPQSVPCRGPLEFQLDELKERLLEPFVNHVASSALAEKLRMAANEAAALAWYTAYPFLVLPTLLEEKVRSARIHWEKQQELRLHRERPSSGARLCTAWAG